MITIMRKTAALSFAFATIMGIALNHQPGQAFQLGPKNPTVGVGLAATTTTRRPRHHVPLFSSSSSSADGTTSTSAESILDEFHSSDLLFRIVVIGNGAILETTSRLGPVSKSNISPKSGERLLTFANEDQSFEFHVKVEQVCKIAFVSAAARRVARFLGEDGTPICSLILANPSDEAAMGWFDSLLEKHGDEIIL